MRLEPEPPRLLLASASPRRRELLALLDVPFDVVVTDVDEEPRPGERADALVERLAVAKAEAGAAVRGGTADGAVVAADTVVVVDGYVLGKPRGDADAAAMLRRLSGRDHEVLTGMAVSVAGEVHSTVVSTVVSFAEMSDAEIAAYVATGEPADKAGAYGIQGRGGRFVTAVVGSYQNVVGLPLAQLVDLLERAGIALSGDA